MPVPRLDARAARRAATTLLLLTAAAVAGVAPAPGPASWREDPAWHAGSAEWALYDATRTIYGTPRTYEATLFTNKEMVDPRTGVKTDAEVRGAFEVFKHNLSEIIPVENYTYRFLTTGFVRVDSLAPHLLTMSSQEDCGATYKRFATDGGRVRADSYCYFPQTGHRTASWRLGRDVRFHDLLSLSLRDYPFPEPGAPAPAPIEVRLVADQTSTRETPLEPVPATIHYVGRERLDLPLGQVEAHALRVEHADMDGTTETRLWFAADPSMRHVMVRYEGPYGVTYRLKRLEWWAYWRDPRP